MKTAIRCLFISSLLALAPAAAFADKAESLAAAVPAEVSEIVSGGTWSDKGKSGFYRAMVITPGEGAAAAVVVQLLSLESEDATPKIAKTVPIKEIAEKGFSSAVLAMDAENENEMTLIVTAYGSSTDQDTALQVKFDGKGAYEILPMTADGADPAAAETPNN